MSKTFSSKAIAFFFLILISSSFLLNLARAEADLDGPSRVTKNKGKGGKKFRKSATDILSEVIDILSAFGGDAVEKMVDDFKNNLTQTTSLLQSLSNPNTIDSVNFFIRSLISGFGDAARQAASENDPSMTMQGSDFSEFLTSFKDIVMKKCEAKSNFATGILPQIKSVMPLMLQGLTELYENIVSSTGFGLTFGLLSQATMLLAFLDRQEYVSKDTFSSFSNFPEEIKGQFEQVIDQLLDTYNIDTNQVDMVLNMAKMYATSFVNNRYQEKDEV